jgi:acyl-CoA synthetase (AMP-forming)/AMP-acid ligase II
MTSSALPPERAVTGDFATVLDLFDAVVEVAGDVDAFVVPTTGALERLTFREWAERADAVAGWLIDEHGVQPGDVVGIALPSGLDYAIAYQGIMRAGAVASGINTRLGPSEIDHIVERMAPRAVIDAPLPHLTVGDPLRRRVALDTTDPIAIVWTGGTTGMPKGAWFDHGCLRAMSEGAAPLSEVGDRRLSPLPFAHVGFMTRVWDELMHVITTIVVPSPWTADAALRLIGDEAVTVCQGVPTQYRMMFDHPSFADTDVSSLRVAGIGAARVPPELVEEMRAKLGCPVVHRYASTESCLATGTRLTDDVATICTTVGRPNGGVELKIVDDGGLTVGPGDVGTVCLRSRAMMRGYWRDPERTAEAIDPDGWLRTGDLGWLGDDGNLRLAGRNTEMYIRGGYNVYPIEIENALGGHPAIAACAMVGASVDDRLGEIGVLFVVPRRDAAGAAAPLDLGDIRTFVKASLADYKAPDVLVAVDELPLTSIGKIDKKLLQPQADQLAAGWSRP